MPELSRFYGIVIRMFSELNVPHHSRHFHAYYQEHSAVFMFDPVQLLAGDMPSRQRRLIEAWAEIHQAELASAWEELQAGRLPDTIDPLK